ncbi:MAG: sterol desaturase family protein [Anaerolineae bacterium]|nr:sterol desaturase family protein [Anaerolineae bacterium]
MPLSGVILWSVLENLVILGVVLLMGDFLVRRYQQHRVTDVPDPLTWIEIGLAASCVALNALVTVAGVLLWQVGIIRVTFDANLLRVAADTLILFFVMDLAMYGFHRAAHLPWLYPLIHQTHHRFENPRPLTLFVLNPFETLGFGVLWLILLAVYPAAWLSIILYLTLNIVFGLVGHLGVEPMPGRWITQPLSRTISTSTFHAEHHLDKAHNYGFYTLIWDHLFGTLSPDYAEDFQAADEGTAVPAGGSGRAD